MSRSIERTHVSASNDHRYDLGDGPRDRSLRVGDRERDAVGELLRRHHLEGRLDSDEFQARLGRCLSAKTYAELDELLVDLPREGEERRRRAKPAEWRPWPLPLLLLPLVPILALAFGGHVAWLAFPLFFFFFVVRPLVWRSRASAPHAVGLAGRGAPRAPDQAPGHAFLRQIGQVGG
jgi:hypothetical protein